MPTTNDKVKFDLDVPGREGVIAVMPLYTAMFEDIDRMDAAAWANWLTDDARFRFGNGDETTTRDAACQGLADFYGLIDGVSHRDHWEDGPTTIVRSDVTYTRKDGATVTVPIVTIYHERDTARSTTIASMGTSPPCSPELRGERDEQQDHR